ncbi:hypothetical protein Naga_101565g2 [Nannochloropsis gaditana]|uniref:Uncharacterized protein n=1 Tax=Nannochloropsis gaditana TaxID=72520 RepID=W7TKD1_9STRA|nr:hypothetical protein Naga_101565g2 [Nannochloropsis gaditana]
MRHLEKGSRHMGETYVQARFNQEDCGDDSMCAATAQLAGGRTSGSSPASPNFKNITRQQHGQESYLFTPFFCWINAYFFEILPSCTV